MLNFRNFRGSNPQSPLAAGLLIPAAFKNVMETFNNKMNGRVKQQIVVCSLVINWKHSHRCSRLCLSHKFDIWFLYVKVVTPMQLYKSFALLTDPQEAPHLSVKIIPRSNRLDKWIGHSLEILPKSWNSFILNFILLMKPAFNHTKIYHVAFTVIISYWKPLLF